MIVFSALEIMNECILCFYVNRMQTVPHKRVSSEYRLGFQKKSELGSSTEKERFSCHCRSLWGFCSVSSHMRDQLEIVIACDILLDEWELSKSDNYSVRIYFAGFDNISYATPLRKKNTKRILLSSRLSLVHSMVLWY